MNNEQKTLINEFAWKFNTNLKGISAAESLIMLRKYFGKSTLPWTQVFEYHKAFSDSREVSETCLMRFSAWKSRDSRGSKHLLWIDSIILVNVLGMTRVNSRLVPKDLNVSAWLWLSFWIDRNQTNSCQTTH